MDGLGEAAVRADHVGGCGVLPCADGPAAHLREEGRGKREEGRGKREEGRGKREEGRGKREEGRGNDQADRIYQGEEVNVTNFGLAAFVLSLVPVTIRAQDLGIEVGARAPVVSVQSLDGRAISL